jgi:hypothetical protein
MIRIKTFRLIIYSIVVAVLLIPAILVFRFVYLNSIEIDHTKASEIRQEFDLKTLQYFGEIAFGPEYSETDYKLCKWEKNEITIGIYGQPREADDKRFLISAIDTLNVILQNHKLVLDHRTNEDQDLKIYFLKFEEILDKHADNPEITGVGGFIEYRRTFWNALRSIDVTINSSMIQESRRKHVILEELTQSLGLMRDSYLYPNSIFYQEYSSDTILSPIDKNLIRLLYNHDLPSGLQKHVFENQTLK